MTHLTQADRASLAALEALASQPGLDRTFATELNREIVRTRAADREIARTSGVRFGGMEAEPRRLRPEDEIEAETAAKEAARAAYHASPRGQFLAALRGLEDLHCYAEADKARAAFNRGFANADKPANPGEIACALLAINELAGSASRKARAALAEILLETRGRAA